jgi:hypothetical protein
MEKQQMDEAILYLNFIRNFKVCIANPEEKRIIIEPKKEVPHKEGEEEKIEGNEGKGSNNSKVQESED